MLKTILVLAYFWLSATVLSPVAAVFMVIDAIGLGVLARPALGFVTRAWARSVLGVIGVRTTVTGLENMPDDERVCFVANHQGDLDILMMLGYMPRPVGFIAKSEAAWFPFLNLWIMALGSAFIDRRNLRQGAKAIARGVRSIERGHSLVIYPEGTRSRGPELLPFRNGSLKLATRSKATIVPVTLDGAYKVWELRRRIEAADVTIVIHPPLRTAELSRDEQKALPDRVRAVIASALPPT